MRWVTYREVPRGGYFLRTYADGWVLWRKLSPPTATGKGRVQDMRVVTHYGELVEPPSEKGRWEDYDEPLFGLLTQHEVDLCVMTAVHLHNADKWQRFASQIAGREVERLVR